jgi:RNA polymerase sigma factor (sigma-70 family)
MVHITDKKRAEKLFETKLRIFYHPIFDELKQRNVIISEMPNIEKFQKDGCKVKKLRNNKTSPEMRPCYEAPLLSFEQEQHLFRKMNYFKYIAKQMLESMNPEFLSKNKIESIEKHLAIADEIRNQIAESNFRLATQILKSKITFYRKNSLTDALLSDAYFDVLKSVDYFDWTKGYKFSTYATWVVKKNFYRDSKQKITYSERFTCLEDSFSEMLNSRGEGYEEEKQYESHQKLVKKLLNLLSQSNDGVDRVRQVKVLEHYFGVNGNKRQTLEQISEEIGVTKERVRQLKEKGLLWIKQKVEELNIDFD